MVRRIVKCTACLKRFATASGKDLCPTCRTKKHDVLQSQQRPLIIRDDCEDDDLQPAREGGKKRKQPITAAAAPQPEESLDVINDRNDTTVNNTDCELKDTVTKEAPVEDVISKKTKTGEGANLMLSIDNTAAKSLEEELHDDDVDLRCITSNTDLNDNAEIDDVENIEQGDASCCGSENDDLLVECIEIDDDSESDSCSSQQEAGSDERAVKQQPQVKPTNNPENDVCYICGTNLSGKGFKSRVAHMKRCSTKFGPAMKTSSAEVEDDFMVPVESSLSSKGLVSNPYKSAQWHGDAGKTVQQSKEKQSMLNQFLKAPVRSLTNVLMAGSRQAKKKADEISQKGPKPGTNNGKKAPFRKGSWASSNRRSGQCPSYKRIPGTDFLCDGFYYAGTLTQNYFLTHFHSDHYGGITKKWNEGIIYCSVSSYILGCFSNFFLKFVATYLTETHRVLSAADGKFSASKSWRRAEISTPSPDERTNNHLQ